MSTKPTAGRVRKVYEFIKAYRHEHRVQAMCRHPSGYYAWLAQPVSDRGQVKRMPGSFG
jgi:hypothetical protein